MFLLWEGSETLGRKKPKVLIGLGDFLERILHSFNAMSLNPGQEQASTNKNHLPHSNSLTFQNFLVSRETRINIFNISSWGIVSSQQGDRAQKKRTKYTAGIIPDILLYLGVCSWQFSACHKAWPLHQAAVNTGKIEFTLNERPQPISNQAVCALHPIINEPGDICLLYTAMALPPLQL